MSLSPEIVDLIVCPQCGADLRYTREQVLFCVKCRLCYPIEKGVPDLSPQAAMPLSAEGKIVPREIVACFTIEKGKDAGLHFRLQRGTCKAIGRKLEDALQTQVFNADFTMTLDEHTRKLISNYLNQTTGKKKKETAVKGENILGSFKRQADLILNDPAASRLHAMVFYDEEGEAGILDLVSKNGTFVNGREVETCFLKSGDEISIGSTKIVVSFK